MGVPLVVEGQVIGVVDVVTRQARRFTEEDMRLLQLVADRVAPAIDRARLYEELRAGGRRLEVLSSRLVQLQEAERRGLARELHDEIGQSLTGLKLMIERGVRARHAGDQRGLGPVQDDIDEALTLVNDLMTRVRDLSMNLRPAMLDDLGLLPALFWHLERYSTQTGVRVDFRHSGLDRRLPPQVETAAFRIVQEALTNVARHAAALEARVRIRVERRVLHLRIEDDGRGFDPERAMSGPSSGLTGMRERARLLKGRLSIETSPGSGTRLAADLPLADGADAGPES